MKNDKKITILVVFLLHLIGILALTFFASKEGVLGKKMQALAVVLVPKSEPVKEKPVEKKIEVPVIAKEDRMEAPKSVGVSTPKSVVVDAVAPSAAVLPSMEFSDGAKEVKTLTDPIQLYKKYVENVYLSRWNRPEIDGDLNFVSQIQITMDERGRIVSSSYLKLSGNKEWDNSVKQTVSPITMFSKVPPKGFPSTVIIQFDVQEL